MNTESGTLILRTGIAGIHHHEARDKVEEYNPGIELVLKREADNEYDKWAIAVYDTENLKIGYIPRFRNQTLARLMDAGAKISACVGEKIENREEYSPTEDERLLVDVYFVNMKQWLLPDVEEEDHSNGEIKKVLEVFKGLCNTIEELAKKLGKTIDGKVIWQAIEQDLIKYMCFMSASDGMISSKEANLLYTFFEYMISPENIREFIEKENLYSSEFASTVPVSLTILMDFENGLEETLKNNDQSITETYIKLYAMIGDRILLCDEMVTDREREDYDSYNEMLRKYVRTHLNKYTRDVPLQYDNNNVVTNKPSETTSGTVRRLNKK